MVVGKGRDSSERYRERRKERCPPADSASRTMELAGKRRVVVR
jgi:hypothetical protein